MAGARSLKKAQAADEAPRPRARRASGPINSGAGVGRHKENEVSSWILVVVVVVAKGSVC